MIHLPFCRPVARRPHQARDALSGPAEFPRTSPVFTALGQFVGTRRVSSSNQLWTTTRSARSSATDLGVGLVRTGCLHGRCSRPSVSSWARGGLALRTRPREIGPVVRDDLGVGLVRTGASRHIDSRLPADHTRLGSARRAPSLATLPQTREKGGQIAGRSVRVPTRPTCLRYEEAPRGTDHVGGRVQSPHVVGTGRGCQLHLNGP